MRRPGRAARAARLRHGAGRRRFSLIAVVFGALVASACAEDALSPPPSASVGDDRAIRSLATELLQASADVPIVCFGEVHGSTADADLRSALLADPRFPARFGRVLFEGASAAHQDLLDQYVLDGEDVDPDDLARVWTDAGRGLQWRLPLYRRLFDELREMNQALEPARRVRLLGGAPPIPWDVLQSPEELAPWIDREAWLHQRLQELLGRERGTLAVYGRHHCERLRFAAHTDLSQAVRSVLSVGPRHDPEVRRRLVVAGTSPAVVGVDEPVRREFVGGIWGEGHWVRGSRFGDVADLVISYGAFENRILVMYEDDLPRRELAELRRRDRWMELASSERLVQSEP